LANRCIAFPKRAPPDVEEVGARQSAAGAAWAIELESDP
jgi:hypothetical protein